MGKERKKRKKGFTYFHPEQPYISSTHMTVADAQTSHFPATIKKNQL